MLSRVIARRRWFGLFFLISACGMMIWGFTLLDPHLRGWGYIVYWTICLILTMLALATALLDMLLVRQAGREERRALRKQALTGLEQNRARSDAVTASEGRPNSAGGGSASSSTTGPADRPTQATQSRPHPPSQDQKS